MATNEEQLQAAAAKLVGDIVGLLEYSLKDHHQLYDALLVVLPRISEEELYEFLSYLRSEKGQVHLQSLRDSTSYFLDLWP